MMRVDCDYDSNDENIDDDDDVDDHDDKDQHIIHTTHLVAWSPREPINIT